LLSLACLSAAVRPILLLVAFVGLIRINCAGFVSLLVGRRWLLRVSALWLRPACFLNWRLLASRVTSCIRRADPSPCVGSFCRVAVQLVPSPRLSFCRHEQCR